MSDDLHVHRYGPPGPLRVLAVHGLTGHGRRWETLANDYLPGVALAAPDLLGHGRSSWAAPWSIDANAAAMATLLDREATSGPVVVVAHSFGASIALSLAASRPDLVAALVLLDPAVGLDGKWMSEIAEAMLASPDYPDRAEARAEKSDGSWADVPAAELDAELDEHLIDLPGGRVGWRISVPAMMSYWSELARDIALPHPETTTTLVRAARTSPPFVTDALTDALRAHLGVGFTQLDFDCDHMIPLAMPTETAALIKAKLGSPPWPR